MPAEDRGGDVSTARPPGAMRSTAPGSAPDATGSIGAAGPAVATTGAEASAAGAGAATVAGPGP
jgi:hypothetical protein